MTGAQRRQADISGFTLIEILVVLTIVALVASVSTLSLQRLRNHQSPAALGRELYAGLTAARYRAMNTGQNQTVDIDVAGKTFAMPGDGDRITLPPSWMLSVTVGRERLAARNVRQIVFQPDGTTSGADIEFGAPNESKAVLRVNWLTGLVEVSTHANN